MLNRQKILLKLLSDNDGHCTKLELTKLAFLLSKEGRSEHLKTFYEFVPYKFGPYSFGLSHELGSLTKEGLISVSDDDQISLTSKGIKTCKQALEARLARDIELLKDNYASLSQSKLVDTVYAKYPWFTMNSQFANRRKAKRVVSECQNYTIGYQSFQVDGLLNRLLECGIKKLIDTRSNPVSRRYGFHKNTLSRLCKLLEIEYEHCPELGVPSSWRQDLETDSEFKALFVRYETEILSQSMTRLKKLASDIKRDPTALLCRETCASQCHRTVLARRLSSINGLALRDLTPVIEEAAEQPLFKFNRILLN
jgi:uncharacterized protein (DUF488 family)